MKRWNYTYYVFLVVGVFSLTVLYSFDPKDSIEIEEVQSVSRPIPPLVQQKLDEKIANYQKTIMEKCRERAYEAAEKYIDSLVAEELKLQASDTLKFPAKPIRPDLREPIILNDSTEIAPILNSNDSIQ